MTNTNGFHIIDNAITGALSVIAQPQSPGYVQAARTLLYAGPATFHDLWLAFVAIDQVGEVWGIASLAWFMLATPTQTPEERMRELIAKAPAVADSLLGFDPGLLHVGVGGQEMTLADTARVEQFESLRTFAVSHGELQFAHMVTAAINGESWPKDRLEAVLRMWTVAQTMTPTTAMLDAIRSTDTTRPDGAVARSCIVI